MSRNKFADWCDQYGFEFVRRLAEDGATVSEMANASDTDIKTFKRWIKKYPRLKAAIEMGRREADFSVVEAVYKKATGYSVSTSKTHKLKRIDYDPETGKKIREYEELAVGVDEDHIAPDLRAGMFWLKNRQPERWNEKGCVQESLEGGVIELPHADAIDDSPDEGEE